MNLTFLALGCITSTLAFVFYLLAFLVPPKPRFTADGTVIVHIAKVRMRMHDVPKEGK